MGFFDRLAFGWRLGTTSLGVVARDKTLMLFPVFSGIACALLIAAFVLGRGRDDEGASVGGLADDVGAAARRAGLALCFE